VTSVWFKDTGTLIAIMELLGWGGGKYAVKLTGETRLGLGGRAGGLLSTTL